MRFIKKFHTLPYLNLFAQIGELGGIAKPQRNISYLSYNDI